MRRKRPPIRGDVIRDARLSKGLTQEQVQEECARRGTKVNNLSRMESGDLKWPNPRTLLALAEVLELNVPDFYSSPGNEVAA
jgi:transcriptional regulator with XRE-family HTH domain